MDSRYSEREANEYVERLGPRWGLELALRVYSSHLIGRDPALVMHGGGNTSVKAPLATLLGEHPTALFVKGSGWDLDSIAPEGFPALDLAYLRRLRALGSLDDRDMLNQLRTHLFDANAPNPSVEALLHAFLPHRFVDHTHPDAALVLTNQPAPEAEAMAREAFGPRWAILPYVKPGLALAQRAADAHELDPAIEGIVLMHHGLVSFGDDARESYERMIAAVDRAERFAARAAARKPRAAAVPRAPGAALARAASLAPVLRGALSVASASPWAPRRVILEHRATDEILGLLERSDIAALASAGPLTPDHVIRTKAAALLLDGALPLDDLQALTEVVGRAVAGYRAAYGRYFAEHAASASPPLSRLDPSPRVVLVPGAGLFASGPTKLEARIAADIAERTLRAKALGNDIGRYEALAAADLFAMEYWSLEQAKLGKTPEPPLARQVALVTGAAGAIGFGICRALIGAGAHVVASDLDEARVKAAAVELDPRGRGLASGLVMDVTDEASVARGLDAVRLLHGGLDILVLNAGVAHVARLEDTELRALERLLSVNVTGYFLVLRAASGVLRAQGTGGNVVVNASKNVFGPGAEFGAYSASKAAGHQLGKVAALELASLGVRVNMINADAVFGDEARPSGLWSEIGPRRASVRGMAPSELPTFYRQRNLLKATVTPEHVGNAVVFFASNLTPTTGATLPVDGGLPEAFPRLATWGEGERAAQFATDLLAPRRLATGATGPERASRSGGRLPDILGFLSATGSRTRAAGTSHANPRRGCDLSVQGASP